MPQVAENVDGTLEVNCFVSPSLRTIAPGPMIRSGAGPAVSAAVPVYAGPLVAVAVIVQTLPGVFGAVKRPVVSTVPQEDCQVAGRFAMNCWVISAGVVTAAGVTTIGEVTVMVVDAVFVVSEASVAVTVQESAAKGAVYRPLFWSMLPQVAAKVAGRLVVNCCVAFSLKLGLSGDRVNAGGAPMTSCAVAVYAVPLAAVAVMVQVLPCDADAVNIPFALMTPHEAFHVTDALAVNCCVCPWPVVAVMGEMTRGEGIVAVVEVT